MVVTVEVDGGVVAVQKGEGVTDGLEGLPVEGVGLECRRAGRILEDDERADGGAEGAGAPEE